MNFNPTEKRSEDSNSVDQNLIDPNLLILDHNENLETDDHVPEWRLKSTMSEPSLQKSTRWNTSYRRQIKQNQGNIYDSQKNNGVVIKMVKDIDWSSIRPLRAGIIVYRINDNNELVFSLGVDSQYGEITDYGGGVSYVRDKTAVRGALREFDEESLGVFGEITSANLHTCWAIYNSELVIIFLKMTIDVDRILVQFRSKVANRYRSEICDIVFLHWNDFQKIINGEKITSDDGYRKRGLYNPVKTILSSIDNLNKILT